MVMNLRAVFSNVENIRACVGASPVIQGRRRIAPCRSIGANVENIPTRALALVHHQ